MKFVLKLILILIFSIILGVGSAIVVAKSMKTVKVSGQWEIDTAVGDTEANIYQKAYSAISIPYAISKNEAIYYMANTDDSGNQLDSNCEYTIRTNKIDARWWNINVYGGKYLIPNELNRYSYRSTNLIADPDGQATIHLSKMPKEGNWLPIGGQNELTLCLRIYHPSQTILNKPELVELPSIIKEECQ